MRLFADTAPLRSTDFRRLWASGIVTTVGASLTIFAAGRHRGGVVVGGHVGRRGRRRRLLGMVAAGAAVIWSVLVWGVTVIGFGWVSGASHGRAGLLLWAALGFLAIGGAADMVSSAFRSTILQQAASDDLRGRLHGVFVVVVGGRTPAGRRRARFRGSGRRDIGGGGLGWRTGYRRSADRGSCRAGFRPLPRTGTTGTGAARCRVEPQRGCLCREPAPAQRASATTTTFSLYTHPRRASISRDRKGVPVAATEDSATLQYPGGEIDLDIVHATEGADGIALGPLLSKTGYTTFDNGFVNTASTKSAITYIDGDAGILRYRGIPIDQLAEKSTFIEVSYLLIYGELPTTDQLTDFTRQIQLHTMLHEDLKRFFDGFPRNAHPMPVLSSAVNALSAYYPDSLEPHDHEQVELSTIRLLAKLPTIAAYAYKKSVGQPFLYPDNSLTLVENFLRMTFGLPAEPYEVDPEVVKALDMLLILHADHEQNCSTSTVRLVGSSQANLFTSISGGINALWGPLHGGANQAVLEMLEKIRQSDDDVSEFVRKVKDREEGVKLMGFGHRVYKNYDPRARIVKEQADKILGKLGGDDDLLSIAKELEEAALTDDYFIERKLYPNVDFYTGLIYRMFTVLFALGRLPGWIAHWREMHDEGDSKIGRPRQIYTGYTERDYTIIGGR
jgi:citrate synthase